MNHNVKFPVADKRHAAICGLFCPACSNFIATQEEPGKLEKRAKKLDRPLEDLKCHGCRSDRLYIFCKEECIMRECAAEKGVDFCGDCLEYPCDALSEFQAKLPHRLELWQDLQRIKEAGYEQWYKEMLEHYSCPQCGTINSAYNLQCRKCGEDPSCKYVELHKIKIEQYIREQKNK